MAYSPSLTLLTDLKTQLGISGATQDSLLTLILTQTGTKTLNETRQATMPDDLAPVIVEMAADAFRLNQNGSAEAAGTIVGTVSSVSDNGQSVSYRDSSYSQVLKDVSSVIKDYSGQLDRFRLPGW